MNSVLGVDRLGVGSSGTEKAEFRLQMDSMVHRPAGKTRSKAFTG